MPNLNYTRNWFIRRTGENINKSKINHFGASAPSLFHSNDKFINNDTLNIVESNNISNNYLLTLAKLSHRKQKFDLTLWRTISNKLELTHHSLTPQQLIVILHCFKQIKFSSNNIFTKCIDQLNGKINQLDLYYLSLISLTFKHNNPPSWLISQVTSQSIYKLQELNIESLNEEQIIWNFESITHILGSFASINCPSQQLFQNAADKLIKLIECIKLIPGHYIHKLITSYCKLSYSHNTLFDLLSDLMFSCKITNKELAEIKSGFDSVNYFNPKLSRFIAYRSVISNNK